MHGQCAHFSFDAIICYKVEDGDDDDGSGFLKLSRTQEWVLGDPSAPINKKAVAKVRL